jgi:RNase P/RNase MRP subunit p29
MAMRWPDIFFKARPSSRQPTPETNSPAPDSDAVTATMEPVVPVEVAIAKSVSQAMDEADTLRVLTRSGGVRIIKRPPAESHPEITPLAFKTKALPIQPPAPPPETAPELNTEPTPEPASPPTPEPGKIENESPTVTPAASAPAQPSEPKPKPASNPRQLNFRRKARLTDLARLVLPAKREEPPATIVPPSFPVEVSAGTVLRAEDPKPVNDAPSPASDIFASEKNPDAMPGNPAQPVPEEIPAKAFWEMPETKETAPAVEPPPGTEPENKPESAAPEKVFTMERKPGPADATPKAEPPPPKSLSMPPAQGEKREFFLTNGERILGKVLSETSDSIYIEHATLGVLTLPRAQIAKRLVELILINGDRIVGDIVAETPDCIFVRHASLGMLTVPHAQRSTRVVEAILKDGDRIVGEVLAETDAYTVIRSSTLGTVMVQHQQLAMLNRKVEQIALKTLPPVQPALENKRSA